MLKLNILGNHAFTTAQVAQKFDPLSQRALLPFTTAQVAQKYQKKDSPQKVSFTTAQVAQKMP